jgi:hypothetical protein
MSRRIIITLLGAAALSSVMIGTGASAAPSHRHHRGQIVDYAGPVLPGPRMGISTPTGVSAPAGQNLCNTAPAFCPDHHGSNGG